MAIIVNDGLSDALYQAIKRTQEGYTRTGYLSTTSCIDSPRERILCDRHDKEIVIRASTLIPSFIGTCVHGKIEEIDALGTMWADKGIAIEKEFVIDIGGIKFSGRPDIYDRDKAEVGDEKTTSLWTFTYNKDGKPEHVKQININAYLIRRWGYPCTKGWVELIFLDWKLSQATRDSKYPNRVETVRIDSLWSDEFCKSFIEDRIRLHLAAEEMRDDNLPPCTEEEQWRKPHVWAVVKKGAARATRLCETAEEAEDLARELGRGTIVEERPGERTRCEFHCDARPFCNQYLQEKTNG